MLTGHTRGSGAPAEGVVWISLTFLHRPPTPTPAIVFFSLLLSPELPVPGAPTSLSDMPGGSLLHRGLPW